MKTLSKKKKIELLAGLYWDLKVSPESLYQYLYSENSVLDMTIDPVSLYRRMLTTLDWYTILKLLPAGKIGDLLQDAVIYRLFPVDLQKKYVYVRSKLQN